MRHDLIPGGIADGSTRSQSAALASGAELKTDLAPPFRARSEAPAASGSLPTVPGYEIIAELGRGGMGVVYLAQQCALKRLVALKMILAGLHVDATARQRFRTEAEALARLQHPNVVQIHDVGEHDGRLFLALENVIGGSLAQKEWPSGTAQSDREAARLVETLAQAVQYMHQQGILHRDLKPNNVLLTADGTPKIADFGLAKVLDANSQPALTRSDMMLGTPCYMAPEQAAGTPKKVDTPTDVYALGAILYQLLTGRPPFHGATPLVTLEQVRTQPPVPPRHWYRTVPRDLETICLKCLEKEPSKRYASATALADDLRCFREGRPIQARPTPVWLRLWRSARRRPAVVAWSVGAAALVCLLLAAGLWLQAAQQLAQHRAEEKYQQFVQLRNEALFYGILAEEDGELFLGAETTANLQRAESAVSEALALAGVAVESGKNFDPNWPADRRSETAADCYTLLLVLADVRGQQALLNRFPPRDGTLPSGVPPTEPFDADSVKGSQEALRILDRARQFGFETQAYHWRRAKFLFRLHARSEAREERERAASLPPAGALDHFLAGAEHYRHGRWEQARNSFHRVLTEQPAHFWAQFFLAVCHLKEQHPEAAKARLNACLTQQPDFVWAYLLRSVANQQLQAWSDAEADLHQALQLNPQADARYALFLTRGILYFHRQDLKRAAADFRSALALKPKQYNAYLSLAQVYLAQGQFEAAAEQMQAALRFRPPVPVIAGYHLERGRSLLQAKRYNEALAACAAVPQLAPQQLLAQEVRGQALLALGRYEQAERSFDEYVQSGGAAKTDIFRGRGLARMKLGKYPEAVEDYTRALELAPDADIYQHRGWAHFFADAWKLAQRDFAKAIELGPRTGDAYTGRGLARVMLGDYRAAVADAETALDLKPDTPEMMHNIACIFAQAVARVETDLPAVDRQAQADSYRRRALEAVHQTLAMLPPEKRLAFWRDKILPDAALAPIRHEAAFRRLEKRYVGRR